MHDDGPGLPSDPGVLARGASGDGSTGLGLDIARRTATASGGALRLRGGQSSGTDVMLSFGAPQYLSDDHRLSSRTRTSPPAR